MKYIIDRFEEEYAVCEKEDKTFISILRISLPENVKEGDIIEYIENKYMICKNETEERKQMVEELTKNMWK